MLPKRGLPHPSVHRWRDRVDPARAGWEAGGGAEGEYGWDLGDDFPLGGELLSGLADTDTATVADLGLAADLDLEAADLEAADFDAADLDPDTANPDAATSGAAEFSADPARIADAGGDRRAERSVRASVGFEHFPVAPVSRRGGRGGASSRGGSTGETGAARRGADAWDPPQSFMRRVLRAVSVPQLVGVIVFLAAIAISLGFVWSQPHAPVVAPAESAAVTEAALGGDAVSDGTGAPSVGSSTGTQGAAGPAAAATTVFVHVVGAVHKPGVVELPASSRVRDAVALAGGATAEAVLAGVNLARPVIDGEQIFVPDAAAMAAGGPDAGGAGALSPGAGPGPAGASATGPIDLNTADLALLETLPRVGPALAQRILDWRATNGRFSSVDQLLEVPGIGAKTLDGFRDRVAAS